MVLPPSHQTASLVVSPSPWFYRCCGRSVRVGKCEKDVFCAYSCHHAISLTERESLESQETALRVARSSWTML
jgi:hypothetical protein